MRRLASILQRSSLYSNRRVLLGALVFGAAIALAHWLQRPPPVRAAFLAEGLAAESMAALVMTLAALIADRAVQSGCSVWRAFAVALPCALIVTVGLQVQWFTWLGAVPAKSSAQLALEIMSALCVLWGMAMLVFLNQRSAARMLGRVRAAELERVQLERRLLDSRLSAAQMQLDPARVMQRLREIRACYAQASPGAEVQLEGLIDHLRGCVSPQNGVPQPRADPLS